MNEETINITEQEAEAAQTSQPDLSNKRKKALPFIITAAVVLIALAVGIGIYNTPANRVQRQLDLGNKYLEEENYEQAAIAFEEAIAIDERCMDAYVGGLEAYLGAGDVSGAQDFYDRTVAMLSGLNEDFLAENMDYAVELYLAADKVYETEPQKAAQILEDGFVYTGENEKVKEQLIHVYLRIAKDKAADNEYEEALIVYDRLLELDNTNKEAITDLSNCLAAYIEALIETEQYDKIRELIHKYSDVASGIDFSDVLARIERLEQSKEWVEISPSLFDFKMMGFDLWEEHSDEIWDALLPLAETEVYGGEGLFGDTMYGFTMANDVHASYWNNRTWSPSGLYPAASGNSSDKVEGTQITVNQYGSGATGIYGSMEYRGCANQVWLLINYWNGLYSVSQGWQGTPMEFEKFIDCPIGKTAEEWYSLIQIEQLKEKGQQVEVDYYLPDSKAWRFQTEWGDGYYFEFGEGQRWCQLAIDCSGQGEEKKVFSMQLIIEPDGRIDNIYVCLGRNYAWNCSMFSRMPDVFQIFS